MTRIRLAWPKHPIFAMVSYQWGRLHAARFKMTKIDAREYPDSFAKANEAYRQALAIIEYSFGPNSDSLKNVARSLVSLLRDAGQNDEAAAIEKRYGMAAG